MANVYLINGRIYKESGAGKVAIVSSRVLTEQAAAGGGVTAIPSPLQSLSNQYATIMAHRLNGHIQ